MPSPDLRPCLASATSKTWTLEGTLLTPEKVIPHGIVTIAGQKIAKVSAVAPGATTPCTTKIDGIILPGLIDLHNHLTWNVFPRWHPPKQYSNREEWRLSAEYQNTLALPEDSLVWPTAATGLGCEANLYAEVKALVGGATSVVGSLNVHKYSGNNKCIVGLVRNLDYSSGFAKKSLARIGACTGSPQSGDPITDVAVNEIFPLGGKGVKEDISPLSAKRLDYLKCRLQSGALRSLLVHLAEGKPSDRASWAEFGKLQATGLLAPGLVIIHGTALQPDDFVAVKNSGAGMVWSPRSNMELYGSTMNVPAAKTAGVTIAIAPDWSPTGSDGMLQELHYAHGKFDHFNAMQLTAMATSIPAKIARIDDRIGRLEAGLYADLLVLRSHRGTAYHSVVNASPADVQLVVVGGRPVYGDSDLMQQLAPKTKFEQVTICGSKKAIDLGDTIAGQSPWKAIKAKLQGRLSKGEPPTSLGSFECPGDAASPPLAGPKPGPVITPDIIHAPGPGPVEMKAQ